MLCCIVLYCIVLYCIVLHCIVLYCIVLYCIVLYCIVLYCIVLYCIVLYCIALYCIVLCSDTHVYIRFMKDFSEYSFALVNTLYWSSNLMTGQMQWPSTPPVLARPVVHTNAITLMLPSSHAPINARFVMNSNPSAVGVIVTPALQACAPLCCTWLTHM